MHPRDGPAVAPYLLSCAVVNQREGDRSGAKVKVVEGDRWRSETEAERGVAKIEGEPTRADKPVDDVEPVTRSRPPRRTRTSLFRISSMSGVPVTPVEGVGRIALVVLCVVLVFAAFFAIKSLVAPLLLGACVASMVRPWMVRMRRRIKGPKRAAAAATALVVLLIALPFVAIAIPVAAEMKELVALFHEKQLGAIPRFLFSLAPTGTKPSSFKEFVSALGPRIADAVPGLLGAASEIALGVFVFLMTLYYVLIDGDSAMRLARRVSPLAHAHLDALVREFIDVGRGVLISVGITAVVEGGAAGIAYFAIGLPSAALLTLITAVAALVPIGTILVWGPIAAVLLSQGRTVAALVVIFTGVVVISGIDHFVRPQLTRLARARLHPLLVFLGMFGGMASLGGWGLFAGPLVVALGVAALRLYDRDQQARLRIASGTPAAPAVIEDPGPPPSSADPLP